MFCAEQIVIPPNLAEVLKAYTKEVVRRQPKDIIEFSAAYFAHLAESSKNSGDFLPPTRDQLRLAYAAITPGAMVQAQQLIKLCTDVGIQQATLDKVFQLGKFGTDCKLSPDEVFVLMLTMTTDSFLAVVAGLFEIFGENNTMDSATLLGLLAMLGQWDPSITPQLRADLAESFGTTVFISHKALQSNSVLQDRLAA
ncbi:hypothetical protein WJX72_010432 [[Myrmecia] bisecta]|uniref:RIIa domain-containing protein n=1 Tax=[Myrmecia] bisecta TaxID=41462 RepID=A0AAW1QGJ4_9CHLO